MKAGLGILGIVVAICIYLFWPHPAAPMVEAPTPKPHRLAPAGTYFATQYASSFTKTGVIGVTPGQELHFLEERPNGKWLVTDGSHPIEISPTELTNDLDIAARVASNDANAQSALTAQLAKDAAEAHKREIAILTSSQPPAASGDIRRPASPLDTPTTRTNAGRNVTGHTIYGNRNGYPTTPP